MISGRDKEPNPPNERRKYKRYTRHFILTYYVEGHPENKEEITQLKNISKGGLCFVANWAITEDTVIEIEMDTPYLTEKTILRGKVLESREEIRNLIYLVRIEFHHLNKDAEFVMDKLIHFFTHGEKKSNE